MRIAIVSQPLDLLIPPYENSIGIWTNRIARQISRSNPVTVFAKRNRVQQSIPSQPNLRYVFVSSLPNRVVSFFGKIVPDGKLPVYAWQTYYLDYILPIALQIRREGFDIIHVHNFSQFVPVLRHFNPHAKIVLHMNCEWLSQLDYDVMDQRIQTSDLVLGSSDYISNKIRDRYPHHEANCKTCYNGVDVDMFRGVNGQRVDHREKRHIMFVGRVSPEKGVHDLIEAFCDIAERFPDVDLDIVGPGGAMPKAFIVDTSDDPEIAALARFYDETYDTQLKRQIPSHLQKRIHFWGGIDHSEITEYYRRAEILINPSYSESFGMSLIEAMASEIPVVVTRVGGMVEIVERSKGGIIVERGNVPELSAAIIRLLEDDGLRKEMGRNGRFAAAEYFSWPQLAQTLKGRYEQLSSQHA